ncbi:MAG TPA: response regulator [Ktedonobacteraceae bacterium]|jgi:two-component system phosphate regulon response regulator PhoB
MHIGLLEDDIATQEMILLVLQEEGYMATIYADAEECLKALGVGSQQPLPVPTNLLIVDWRLGGNVSGIEVIQQIRQDKRLQDLPVILATAAPFSNVELLQTLQVALLEKPFSVDDLTTLVKRTIQQ